MMPVSYINETGDFHVVDNKVEFQNSVQKLLSEVKTWPKSTLAELKDETGLPTTTINRTLHVYGWHTVAGGKGGSSPWHQDGDKPCPYAKTAKTVQDAVRFLEGALSLGETREADILTQADKVGLTDALLARGRKRLGVTIQEGVWALPSQQPTEPEPTAEPDKGGRPKDKDALSPTERKRLSRARRKRAEQPEQVSVL
jgi:hypothetical protein